MPEVKTSVEFRCPQCGSRYFGTVNAHLDTGVRNCHNSRSCKFTWPVSDDWRYFVRVTVEPFANREEYEAASR